MRILGVDYCLPELVVCLRHVRVLIDIGDGRQCAEQKSARVLRTVVVPRSTLPTTGYQGFVMT